MSRPGPTRRSVSYQEGSQSYRFRYEDESTKPTVLQGETSTDGDDGVNITFPTLVIHNVQNHDRARITISPVTANEPFRAHPNTLMGSGCQSKVFSRDVKVHPGNNTFVFNDLRIIRTKTEDCDAELEARKNLRIDPFQQGFNHVPNDDYKLTAIRLCFQVKLLSSNKILKPIVSTPIYNTRESTKAQIVRYSARSGSAKGGAEVIILCNVMKEKPDVVFYTKSTSNEPPWAKHAMGLKVHSSQAMYCFAPPYRDIEIKEKVTVYLELRRSDGTRSDPVEFHYLPDDTEEELLNRKKLKVIDPALSLLHDENYQSSKNLFSPPSTEDLHKLLDSLPCNNSAATDNGDVNMQSSFFDQIISTPNPSYNDTRCLGEIQASINENTTNPFIANVPGPSHFNREFYRHNSINLPVLHNDQMNSAIMNGNLWTPSHMQPHLHHLLQNAPTTLTDTGQISHNVPAQSNTLFTPQGDMQAIHAGPPEQHNWYEMSENRQWMSPNIQFSSNNVQSRNAYAEGLCRNSRNSNLTVNDTEDGKEEDVELNFVNIDRLPDIYSDDLY
ncbi:unnamed protein product [Spodoptera exigua]|nr:unnamed protein product [Spodoptera exigua]